MSRRVVETAHVNRDCERLLVVTVYEEGLCKCNVKKMDRLSKMHGVLYKCSNGYEYK